MTHRSSFAIAAAAFLALGAGLFAAPREARADILSSCGNITVNAQANCKLVTSGGCTAQCTPVSFQASCAAQLETTCSGGCTATVDANCTASCNGTCEGSCTANPGNYNCQGSCEADCEGNCSGSCSAAADQAQCQASCKASCGGHCNVTCQGTPPSATCMAKCQASCSGSCTAKANLSCDIDCQTKGYAMCEASLQGGCMAQCSQPKGALFCDGQYVNTTNVDQCVADLESLLHITVSGSASADCDGGVCEAQAQGKASCAIASGAPGDQPVSGGFAIGALGLAIGAAVRRSRKRAAKN